MPYYGPDSSTLRTDTKPAKLDKARSELSVVFHPPDLKLSHFYGSCSSPLCSHNKPLELIHWYWLLGNPM